MVDYYREKYDFQDLQKVLIRLRQPDGCPWDAAQTHTSIRKDFLEEVYASTLTCTQESAGIAKVALSLMVHCVLLVAASLNKYPEAIPSLITPLYAMFLFTTANSVV